MVAKTRSGRIKPGLSKSVTGGPPIIVVGHSGAVVHRPATLEDAAALFDLRRRSILELASRGLPAGEAETWAAKLTLAGMERKLRAFEIGVADLDGVVAGWGAIHGDILEGLYTAPQFAGRGVASGMLTSLEGLMIARGAAAVHAEASSNAKKFYLRRGYRLTGPQTADRAWPIRKELR
jgi:putative acetyltransferase